MIATQLRRLLLVALACVACHPPAASHEAGSPQREPAPVLTRDLDVAQASALLLGDGHDAHFEPTTLDERAAVLQAVALLRPPPDVAADVDEAAAILRSVDLELEIWKVEGQRYHAIFQRKRRRAAGAYLLRVSNPAAPRTLILQAPHPRFDSKTAQITTALFFLEANPLAPDALFLATGHRFRPRPDARDTKYSPSDVAHNPYHLFTVFTAAVSRTSRELYVVSVHGFADDPKHKRDAVVSAGRPDRASVWSVSVAKRLRQRWGKGVRLYPTQTSVLGGTTNAQGRYLEGRLRGHFLHLELSRTTRKRLSGSVALTELAEDLAPIAEDSL